MEFTEWSLVEFNSLLETNISSIDTFSEVCDKIDEAEANYFYMSMNENDLIETTSVIDSESILSRVYKKCDGRIDDGVLGMLIVFNKHIQDEQYESADKMKTYIINFY